MKNGIYIRAFTMLLSFSNLFACTIIIGYKNGKVLVGNNEDWYYSNAKYWFEKPKKKNEKYNAYFFGFEGDGRFAQGGMNEKGLMFDGTYISRIEIDRDNMRKNKLKAAPVHLFKNILKQCSNVDEAETVINRYFIPYIRTAQVLIIDANGGYLVIKANGVIEKGYLEEGKFKIITNFHLEELNNNSYTCYRYDLAKEEFNKQFENSIQEFENILYLTQQNYPAATVYSNIYDLEEKSSTLYYNANFNNKVTIDFEDLLNTDPVLLEKALFKKRMVDDLIKSYKKGGITESQQFYEKAQRNAKSEYEVNLQQLIDFSEFLYIKNEFEDYNSFIKYIDSSQIDTDLKLVTIGKSQLRNGNIKAAKESFKKALKLNPNNFWAKKLSKQYNNEKACNSTISLDGYNDAKVVMLYGSFNEWRGYDNVCFRENGSWKACVKAKSGKHVYKFKVDGEWVDDKSNPTSEKMGKLKVSTVQIN